MNNLKPPAGTGPTINGESNVIRFPRVLEKPVLDVGDEAAKYASAITITAPEGVTFATIDAAAQEEIDIANAWLAAEDDWI